eukprot:6953329-Prymnesium_polylepis.1
MCAHMYRATAYRPSDRRELATAPTHCRGHLRNDTTEGPGRTDAETCRSVADRAPGSPASCHLRAACVPPAC